MAKRGVRMTKRKEEEEEKNMRWMMVYGSNQTFLHGHVDEA